MSSINRRLTKNLRDYYTTGMGGMSRLIFTEFQMCFLPGKNTFLPSRSSIILAILISSGSPRNFISGAKVIMRFGLLLTRIL